MGKKFISKGQDIYLNSLKSRSSGEPSN